MSGSAQASRTCSSPCSRSGREKRRRPPQTAESACFKFRDPGAENRSTTSRRSGTKRLRRRSGIFPALPIFLVTVCFRKPVSPRDLSTFPGAVPGLNPCWIGRSFPLSGSGMRSARIWKTSFMIWISGATGSCESTNSVFPACFSIK